MVAAFPSNHLLRSDDVPTNLPSSLRKNSIKITVTRNVSNPIPSIVSNKSCVITSIFPKFSSKYQFSLTKNTLKL